MEVGVIGLGKTAKAVVSILLEQKNINVKWILRRTTSNSHYIYENRKKEIPVFAINQLDADQLLEDHPVDVIVDFSSEKGIEYYGNAAASKKVAIISAISNYPESKIKTLKTLAEKTCVFYSPNITIGVNFLLLAAKTLKRIAPNADISIIEEHFSQKNDTSGTAKVIASSLEIDHKEIKSIRAGGIVGTHEILFGFPFQTVRLKHESISREAFGNGIKFILENLDTKKAGYYTMERIMSPYFHSEN